MAEDAGRSGGVGAGRPLQPAASGAGPLLERDYWAVIEGSELSPGEVASLVAGRFHELAPPSLVRFRRTRRGADGEVARGEGGGGGGGGDGGGAQLAVGDELEVDIAGAGRFAVRVIHRDARSITIGTLPGHPEAGRITFGAYRHRRGDVVFHIRSRARSGSRRDRLGFLLAGDPMQTNSWTDFINRVAATAGKGVMGVVHAEKRRVAEEPGDVRMDRPTFIAEGA